MKPCSLSVRIAIKCVITRLLFTVHLVVVAGRVWAVYEQNNWFWFLLTPVALMLTELVVVLCIKRGNEMKRFCPSQFFYLLGAVPSVWFIELDRLEALRDDKSAAMNSTSSLNVGGFALSATMSATGWAMALEQSMMFLLIIGKWIMPKGDMSREQLSQLLMVYLGMAIDILELFEMFKEDKVLNSRLFIFIVLSAFSWSLMQYTFILTPPKKTSDPIVGNKDVAVPGLTISAHGRSSFLYKEKFPIFVCLFMQDLPFLAIRLFSLAHFQVYSYANIFFTVKNAIMVTLQLYRLLALACEKSNNENDTGDTCLHAPIDVENKMDKAAFPSNYKKKSTKSVTEEEMNVAHNSNIEFETVYTSTFSDGSRYLADLADIDAERRYDSFYSDSLARPSVWYSP